MCNLGQDVIGLWLNKLLGNPLGSATASYEEMVRLQDCFSNNGNKSSFLYIIMPWTKKQLMPWKSPHE